MTFFLLDVRENCTYVMSKHSYISVFNTENIFYARSLSLTLMAFHIFIPRVASGSLLSINIPLVTMHHEHFYSLGHDFSMRAIAVDIAVQSVFIHTSLRHGTGDIQSSMFI